MKRHYNYGNELDKKSYNTICGIKVEDKYTVSDRYKVNCKNCIKRMLELRV